MWNNQYIKNCIGSLADSDSADFTIFMDCNYRNEIEMCKYLQTLCTDRSFKHIKQIFVSDSHNYIYIYTNVLK